MLRSQWWVSMSPAGTFLFWSIAANGEDRVEERFAKDGWTWAMAMEFVQYLYERGV